MFHEDGEGSHENDKVEHEPDGCEGLHGQMIVMRITSDAVEALINDRRDGFRGRAIARCRHRRREQREQDANPEDRRKSPIKTPSGTHK